jgi:hypothetical protein
MGYRQGTTAMVREEDKTVKNVMVHGFFMGDSEDPYLMAAFPISEWEKSEQGQYVMERAIEQPTFFCDLSPERFGYKVSIYAYLKDEDLTFYFLKFPQKK